MAGARGGRGSRGDGGAGERAGRGAGHGHGGDRQRGHAALLRMLRFDARRMAPSKGMFARHRHPSGGKMSSDVVSANILGYLIDSSQS